MVFDPETTRRCIAVTGIDPNDSYRNLMLEIRVGGPRSQHLFLNLDRPLREVRISPRKREVMTLLANGYQVKEIAAKLEISLETVKTHLARVNKRLNARNGVHAVSLCIVLGLLESPDEEEGEPCSEP